MISTIERLLYLRPGDLRRGFPIVLYLFLVISSYMMARVARDALFLDHFEATSLPYVDMTVAVIIGLIMALYMRAGRRITLYALTAGSLGLFAILTVGFWQLTHYHPHPYLYPVFYVWVGIFGVLASSQVWTLASFLLTTREAKRMMGLLGSGAITGGIAGGFFSTAVSRRFGTEALLLIIALAMVICLFLLHFLWKNRRTDGEQALPEERKEAEEGGTQGSMRESLRLIWQSPYLLSIAGLICLASVVTAVVGWQFKAISKAHLPEKNDLAAFWGMFYGYTGILALLMQLLCTSRLLKRAGLGVALLVLPAALLAGSLSVLVLGTLSAVVILRSADNVFRYSVDRSAVEMLYFPVPAPVKMQIKPFIDTVIWRLGDGLGGVVVLVYAVMLGMSAWQLTYVNILLLFVWLFVVVVARKYYVVTLSENIRNHCLDRERSSMALLERSTVEVWKARLRSDDPNDVLYALEWVESDCNAAMFPAIQNLLSHRDTGIRRKALSMLNAAGDLAIRPRVEQLLSDGDIGVRTEALLYLAHHGRIDPLERIQELGDFPSFSVQSAMAAYLAWPGPMQNTPAAQTILDAMLAQQGEHTREMKMEAARLIALLPDHYGDQLGRLVEDADPAVAREALKTVGALKSRRFLPDIFRCLEREPVCLAAMDVLGMFGDEAVKPLAASAGNTAIPIGARREIPRALLLIGSAEAGRALHECLLAGDAGLRMQAIASLNTFRQRHPECAPDAQMIGVALYAEITGQHRSYQISEALRSRIDGNEPIMAALHEDLNRRLERIFRLMGLLNPSYDFMSVYAGFQSGNHSVHDNALEFLDNVLDPHLRAMLVPLLDRELHDAERARIADRMTGMPVNGPEHALDILLGDEEPDMKTGVVRIIGKLGLISLYPKVRIYLEHPDPLLREAARATLAQDAP